MLFEVFEVQNGHFVQIYNKNGNVDSTPREYKSTWMCHMCRSIRSEYKVITEKKFALICPSCARFDKIMLDVFIGKDVYEYFQNK
jgi:hypothetical protein